METLSPKIQIRLKSTQSYNIPYQIQISQPDFDQNLHLANNLKIFFVNYVFFNKLFANSSLPRWQANISGVRYSKDSWLARFKSAPAWDKIWKIPWCPRKMANIIGVAPYEFCASTRCPQMACTTTLRTAPLMFHLCIECFHVRTRPSYPKHF